MKRSILASVVLALTTGGLVLTGGGAAKAGEQSPFSLKPTVDMDTLGAKGAPASLVTRRQGADRDDATAGTHSIGNRGAPASMVRSRRKEGFHTNVVPAGPERTGSSGRPASLTAQ